MATNALILIAAAAGAISDLGTLLCGNLVLLVGITTLMLKRASRSREQKGQGPLDPAGIAVAVGISVLIQIVAILWLQSLG